jgi:hypothetical protein
MKLGVSFARITPLPSVVTRNGSRPVEHLRIGACARDQLHQIHVARRIEEVHAAEAGPQRLGQRLRQSIDRQARGVGGEHRLLGQMRRDLLVQRFLQIRALGDGLDHQIAFAQQRQMLIVVRGLDVRGLRCERERARLELVQILDRLEHVRVRLGTLRGELEQQRRHIAVGKMRGDLRAHHARAEHGDFAHR